MMTKTAKQAKQNWVDKTIGWISPERALKRWGARLALETLSKNGHNERSFEAISSNRIRGDWTNLTTDADSANVSSLETLRNRIRQLSRDNGIVSGPLKRMADNVIGRGIRPQCLVTEDGQYDFPQNNPAIKITIEIADRFVYQAEKYWAIWVKKSDAQLRQNFYRQAWLAFKTMIQDGEVLIVARSSKNHGRIIPLCLEIIEIDRLLTPTGEIQNPQIRNGIEFDINGVPIRYFILRKHPGTNFLTKTSPMDYEIIDAYASNGLKKVFHLYNILRPGQSRGYTPFAACLKDLQDTERYIEAFVVGARIDACLAAFIESPAAYQQFSNLDSNVSSEKITSWQPGMVAYTQPGEKVIVHDPKRVNNQFRDFIISMQMLMANALDVPYEIFSNDWKGLSYSNARTVLLQAYLAFRIYQELIISDLCIPVWENFISDCILAGLIEAPNFQVRREDYFHSAWIAPGWQWIDPVKEAEGKRIEIDNNLDTHTNILAQKGMDFDETMEQIAKERLKVKELEEKYGISMKPESLEKAQGAGNNDNDGKNKDEE